MERVTSSWVAIRIKQRKGDGSVGGFICLGRGGGRRQASGLEGSNEAEPQVGVYGGIDANEILRGRNICTIRSSWSCDSHSSLLTQQNLGAAQHETISRIPPSTMQNS